MAGKMPWQARRQEGDGAWEGRDGVVQEAVWRLAGS